MYEYDTKNADKEDWARFEHYLQQFNEEELDDLKTEEQLQLFYDLLEEAFEKCLNKKTEFLEKEENSEQENDFQKKSKNFIPKEVRNLMKKKQKLSQKILKSKSWEKNYSVMLELQEVEEKLSDHYNLRRRKVFLLLSEKILKNCQYNW